MSLVFGQLICIPTRLASSCKIVRASSSTYANGANVAMSVEISELVFTELYPETTMTQRATYEVVNYTVEEVWCNDTSLLHASLDGELF